MVEKLIKQKMKKDPNVKVIDGKLLRTDGNSTKEDNLDVIVCE